MFPFSPLLLLLLFLTPSLSTTLYSTLGISSRSSQSQIKKAFKQMSLKHHPDRNQEDPNAASKYQQIVNAYQTLKDPVKKRQYDRTGSTDSTPQMNRHQYHNYNHNPFQGFQQMFRQFEQASRGRSHNHHQYQQQQQRRQQQQQQEDYDYVQYVDEFGRIRTVMVKKDGGRGRGWGVGEGVMSALMVPLQMMLVFGIAYLVVSMFSNGDERGRQGENRNKGQDGKEDKQYLRGEERKKKNQ